MVYLKQAVLARDATSGRVVINFHPSLATLMREARYLDRVDLPGAVPEVAVNMALQGDKFRGWLEGLEAMLSTYYAVVDALKPFERELLSAKLGQLERCLDAGLEQLNWNSLSVPEFIASANKAIADFQSLIGQVQKNCAMIEKAVATIANTRIVAALPEGGDVLDLQEFFELVDSQRRERTEELVKAYRTISPLLGKIEELVAGSNTGKSPQLGAYYCHWERIIFSAINSMVVNALEAFQELLASKHAPLFRVTLSLQNLDVCEQPPVGDVNKLLSRVMRSLVDSARQFVRWMDGTCLECPEQYPNGPDEEPLVFSFFMDIGSNPAVIKHMIALNQAVQKALGGVHKHMDAWRRHQSLWKLDKAAILEKYKAKAPHHGSFEEKLSKYARLASDVWSQAKDFDCGFIRVSCHALAASVREESLAWVRALYQTMRELDLEACAALHARMDAYRVALYTTPDTLEDLKRVLNTISTIRSEGMVTELVYADLEERFRTRLQYAQPEDVEAFTGELELPRAVRARWERLTDEADIVDSSLDDVKEKFSQTTREQVADFMAYTVQLQEQFKMQGPGRGSIELEAGYKLLKQFQDTLDEACSQRDALMLAEKLFGLSVTSYPQLMYVEAEMRKLHQARRLWAARAAGSLPGPWPSLRRAAAARSAPPFPPLSPAAAAHDLSSLPSNAPPTVHTHNPRPPPL